MNIPIKGWRISRNVMGRDGSSDVTFEFSGVSLPKAKLLADMSKFNAECRNGLHSGSAPYSKSDFDAVISGIPTPVGNLIPIKG